MVNLGLACLPLDERATWAPMKVMSLEAVYRGQSDRLAGLQLSACGIAIPPKDRPFRLPARIDAEPPEDSRYCIRPGLEEVLAPGEAPS